MNIVEALLVLVVAIAAITDYRSRRVPNWLTLSVVVLGIGLNCLLYQTAGLLMALKGLGLAVLIYVPLYLLRAVGGGDVKLMAAVGAIAGPAHWVGIMLFTAILGGICAIVIVTLKRRLGQTFTNVRLILISLLHGHAPFEGRPQLDVRSDQALRLPHAVVIAGGTIGFLVATVWARR